MAYKYGRYWDQVETLSRTIELRFRQSVSLLSAHGGDLIGRQAAPVADKDSARVVPPPY